MTHKAGSILKRAKETNTMESEMVITGAIVDSWIEPTQAATDGTRLVLQVAPRGRPKDLVIVEAEPSLVPDRFWLEDLSENLCTAARSRRSAGRRSMASSPRRGCNWHGKARLEFTSI